MNGGVAEPLDAHFDFFELRPLADEQQRQSRLAERQKLRGTWQATLCQLSGNPLEQASFSRFVFGLGSVAVTEGDSTFDAEYTVDLTKQPKQLVLWNEMERSTVLLRFIYKLESDTLTLALNPTPDGLPPTELESKEGDGILLVKLRRVLDREAAEPWAVPGRGMPWTPQRRLTLLDSDRDGTLTLEEFAASAATPEAIQASEELFKTWDSNKDGTLRLEEVTATFERARFWAMDRDSDGVLSLKEFSGGEMNSASLTRARRAFDLVDHDGDDVIRFDEYRRRPQEAWFARLDANENGQVSYDEWAAGNVPLVRDGRAARYFAAVDLDGDGILSPDEFKVTPQEGQFIKKDTDADGKLTIDEFILMMDAKQKEAGSQGFSQKDKDKDGFLSFREYAFRDQDAAFWQADRDGNNRLSLDEFETSRSSDAPNVVETTFRSIDRNHDGSLSLAEFNAQAGQ
jgi:uncharacterized protein (TIGR03067 family)